MPKAKAVRSIERLLKERNINHRFENGSKHVKLFINNELVRVVHHGPKCVDTDRRLEKKILAGEYDLARTETQRGSTRSY